MIDYTLSVRQTNVKINSIHEVKKTKDFLWLDVDTKQKYIEYCGAGSSEKNLCVAVNEVGVNGKSFGAMIYINFPDADKWNVYTDTHTYGLNIFCLRRVESSVRKLMPFRKMRK